jgi:hypothetical protein
MGFDFTVTFTGSSTQSVTAGQSASYTLVLTPLSGSSGNFSFACGTLPTNALCVFSPAGETLNAGVSGNVVVQISTGSATASARPRRLGGLGVLPLVCAVLLLPFGWRRRRGLLHTVFLVVFLGVVAGSVASCTSSGGGTGGGSGGGAGSSGLTPDGTYSIPITVTSTGVSHGATVTLTVD